ncbi:MAG: NAD(P)/FAD-dependent oxidoreductase [Solirubrobacteraceae bacterium]|nr:NAD(P)/FAD-dependent oxidoreductase [Solirubrobacteraceae bacterium]
MSHDAVIIGAGPNGLAAAIRLAEAGRSVLVLEAADAPGGAVRTEELTLPGFRHDTFSSVYPAGAASPVFARMPLAAHGLEWVHPAACAAHPLPRGQAAMLYRSVEDTAESLDRLAPGDGAAWRAFVAPFVEHIEAVKATMLSGFPPVGGPLRMLRDAGPRPLLAFSRLLPEPATRFAQRTFEAPGSRAWLYGAAMHGDAPPEAMGSAIAGAYLNLLGHAVGWPSPRGGAQALTDALVGHFRSLGGELRCDSRVTTIMSALGRVTGVRTAGGDEISTRTVIADVMPHALAAMAGDGLRSWYRSALRRYTYGASTLKLDWALDGPIPWINDEVRKAGTVHVGGSEDAFLASVAASRHALPEDPFLLVGQQSVADPTRAPAGKHTAWAYTHGPQHGVDWSAEQGRHVERMEAQIERYAPGFTDRILARHVLGPAELQARNANLVGGDVGGGSYRFRQVLFRPLPAISPYRTPLTGLFLGSAATFPGGAVHGVPGDAAARAALRRRLR